MPHRKHRGRPLDLVLSDDVVDHEFAEELADGGERNIAVENQQKNRQLNNTKKKANGGSKDI
ncbi:MULTISPECIES: hypothetical protein [Alkalihalobacterium]|uniref:YfhD family protein n=1 Tax=Alkalihalobacterium chitinilyticum TaxID=2980103 RepID=A0ABT5VH30_9BACI|nr:hypothetical protein [Alkalihalobacterium chitinilyticum]MDE5414481.1 hypothetical protein [Alkalihalobacterium chitinilyticum]MEB1807021.1 hypothetical protein [Bacillaceae bacterium]